MSKVKGTLLIFTLCLISSMGISQAQTFEIRGVLPWHNFLSGPSGWNEADYEAYLDDCREKQINFIAFHNYTGGGERYFNYVEPMIKIAWKNVLPEAFFDNGSTARWGYLPLPINEYPFGTQKLFASSVENKYFGADCAVQAQTLDERYEKAQGLMRKVLDMAHEREMQMAMGFEFGVAPPEYASIRTRGDMYWMGKGSLLYNPFNADATGILYSTIDNILESYPGIDWIYLWLNEHCMFGIDTEDALKNKAMAAYYNENAAFYSSEITNEALTFLGVWSQAYIQKAYDYIKIKAPSTKIVIGGWGSEDQMALLLKGLHQSLPGDIVFSMLNPNQGQKGHPSFFREIARERKIWSIPWLEGDASLWHLQPRVQSMTRQVLQSAGDSLNGVVAIHWRTEEVRHNFEAFSTTAFNPEYVLSTYESYKEYCSRIYGKHASKKLAPLLTHLDTTGILSNIRSPVYFAYEPTWGRLRQEQKTEIATLISAIDECIRVENEGELINNLEWLRASYQFSLLLNDVGVAMEPAWIIREDYLSARKAADLDESRRNEAILMLKQAPIEEMIRVFSSRVRSRGELGELSSIIQRVWNEYLMLSSFLESEL